MVNNAGISAWSSVNETNIEVYKKVMNMNYMSVVSLTKSVLPDMIKRRSGQIVTNTSLSGKFGSKKRSVYAAAKHALHGFIDSFRYLNKDPHNYSWWSYRAKARDKNLGWRIDYNMLTESLLPKLRRSGILPHAKHSDHCPVFVEIAD